MNNNLKNGDGGCFMSPDFDQTNTTVISPVRLTWTVLAVVNSTAIPPTFLINLLIIWTILKDKTQRIASFNVLLAILATTDLLVGCAVLPSFVAWLSCLLVQCEHVCIFSNIYGTSSVQCCSLSLSTVMMVCLERYLAIVHPYFYTTKVTMKKFLFVTSIRLLCTPTGQVVARILVDDEHAYRKLPLIVLISLNIIVIVFCTIRVHMVARCHRRAIKLQKVEQNTNKESTEEKQRNTNELREYKRAFTASILVLASMIFYFPMVIFVIIEATFGKNVSGVFKYIALPIYTTFVHLQSLVNPVIISLRYSYIRKGVMQKLCKFS